MKVRFGVFVAVLIIFMLLFGPLQLNLPETKAQQSSLIVDRTYWLRLSTNAWRYYQPGVGVDSTTGLHSAGLGFSDFTDWDLGVYIQATIDANKLGILDTAGSWGADARFNKILTFLKTRQLTSDGQPYCWYKSTDGTPSGYDPQWAADTGELLVALNNLRGFRPNLAETINYIVYNRTNYTRLQQNVDDLTYSRNIYDYYIASGFACSAARRGRRCGSRPRRAPRSPRPRRTPMRRRGGRPPRRLRPVSRAPSTASFDWS